MPLSFRTAGSSPRLRGTGSVGRTEGRVYRFIPAPAGNRPRRILQPGVRTVHPRACGEQSHCRMFAASTIGSSPRLRGTERNPFRVEAPERFIPAPAGNSVPPRSSGVSMPVHPRACGEQAESVRWPSGFDGSSPRLRGTGGGCIVQVFTVRFIPAPAGNSRRGEFPSPPASVHPRACGEQVFAFLALLVAPGSSPRLRGTGSGPTAGEGRSRFIPAPAGNRVRRGCATGLSAVHPRACGEQDVDRLAIGRLSGSSPRLRGTASLRK